MFEPGLFEGSTVVMTGAGRGIGRAAAVAYLAHGAHVIAHLGRTVPDDVPPVFAEAGDRFAPLTGDFTIPDGPAAFVEAVKASTDRIHVLVNNAGTMFGRFPAGALTDNQYESLVALNQTAVVKITRDLLPLLKASAPAAIVNTSSISARAGGSAGSSVYSATKAFVSTYSRALARELAPDGIRVNVVSPGTIDTDFHARYSTPEKLAAARTSIPAGRLGVGEDCAPAFLFLSAESLSGYITGQVLEVNGGQLMP
ncbi:MAG: SDR family oxidoreductase [Pseudomonadota bacterium]